MNISRINRSTFLNEYQNINNCRYLNSVRGFYFYFTKNSSSSSITLLNAHRIENNSGNINYFYIKIDTERFLEYTCDNNTELCLKLETFVDIRREKIYYSDDPYLKNAQNLEYHFGYTYYTYINLLYRMYPYRDIINKFFDLNINTDFRDYRLYLVMRVHDNPFDYLVIVNRPIPHPSEEILRVYREYLMRDAISYRIMFPFLLTITDSFYDDYITFS